jgi:hypothetical protein
MAWASSIDVFSTTDHTDGPRILIDGTAYSIRVIRVMRGQNVWRVPTGIACQNGPRLSV